MMSTNDGPAAQKPKQVEKQRLLPALMCRVTGRWKERINGGDTYFCSKSPLLGLGALILFVMAGSLYFYWWELPWPWGLVVLLFVFVTFAGFGQRIYVSQRGALVGTEWYNLKIKSNEFSLQAVIGEPLGFDDEPSVLAIRSDEDVFDPTEARVHVQSQQKEWLAKAVRDAFIRAQEAKNTDPKSGSDG